MKIRQRQMTGGDREDMRKVKARQQEGGKEKKMEVKVEKDLESE